MQRNGEVVVGLIVNLVGVWGVEIFPVVQETITKMSPQMFTYVCLSAILIIVAASFISKD